VRHVAGAHYELASHVVLFLAKDVLGRISLLFGHLFKDLAMHFIVFFGLCDEPWFLLFLNTDFRVTA
jgi:hypothetical protein